MNKTRLVTLALMAGLLIAALVFSGGCYPMTTEGEEGGGFDWTIIIFLVLILPSSTSCSSGPSASGRSNSSN